MKDELISERTPRQQVSRATGKQMKQLMMGFRTRLDERLKNHDITGAQVRLLYEIRERPGITGAQLARALFVSPQSVQTMVARALEHGWLLRGVHNENSRLVRLRLTAAGTRLLAQADLVARELESELWAGISQVEMRAVSRVLARCLSNLGA